VNVPVKAAEAPTKPQIAAAKPEAAKPVVKLDMTAAKTETAKAAPATRPAPEPRVLPPTPVKAASAKPASAKTDPKADSKNAIPGLRLSANAF